MIFRIHIYIPIRYICIIHILEHTYTLVLICTLIQYHILYTFNKHTYSHILSFILSHSHTISHTLTHTLTYYKILSCILTYCKILSDTLTYCNILSHTANKYKYNCPSL